MRAETYDQTDKRVDVAGQIQDNRTIVRSVATSPARAPLELPIDRSRRLDSDRIFQLAEKLTIYLYFHCIPFSLFS